MSHLDGGTNDQITVQPVSPTMPEGPCDVCEMHDVEEPQEVVVEFVDRGRNWLGVLGKDILYLCKMCARQHTGKLLKRVERVLDDGELKA